MPRKSTPDELRRRCIEVLTTLVNTGHYSLIRNLTGRDRVEVCAGLSVHLQLLHALTLDPGDLYWKRRTLAEFQPPHVYTAETMLRVRPGRQTPSSGRCSSQKSFSPENLSTTVSCSRNENKTQTDECRGTRNSGRSNDLPVVNHVKCKDGDWKRRYLEELLSLALSNRLRAVHRPDQSKTSQSRAGAVSSLHGTNSMKPSSRSKTLDLETIVGACKHETTDWAFNTRLACRVGDNAKWMTRVISTVRQLSRLQSVSLVLRPRMPRDVPLPASATAQLAEALSGSALTSLSLTQSGLTDAHVQSLLSSQTFPSLATLDLSHNCVGSASAPLLASVMSSPNFRVLKLVNNVLDSEGCSILVKPVTSNPCLTSVTLDGNPLYSAGVACLLEAAARESAGLQILSLSGCRAGGSPAEDEVVWKALMAAVSGNLRYINLASNHFCREPQPSAQEHYQSSSCCVKLSSMDGYVSLTFTGTGAARFVTDNHLIADVSPVKLSIEQETDKFPGSSVKLLDGKPSPPGLPKILHGISLTRNQYKVETEYRALKLFVQ
ncbi:hypothetical protein FHG87_012914 [Trinorchestia longiramus]|nr:hypothetical protein FHG87_012914 [Trinorchestia longiramus]